MKDNTVTGVIYPIKEENMKILLNNNRPIYIKYLTHSGSKNPTKLKKDFYLFFYLSGKDKTIIGYSKIINVSFIKTDEIKDKYIDRIQMNEAEFNNYISNRSNKLLLSLELNKVKIFDVPITSSMAITMSGRYINNQDIEMMIGKPFNESLR